MCLPPASVPVPCVIMKDIYTLERHHGFPLMSLLKTDIAHNFGSFPSPIPGRYIILSEQESAGKCLTWLRDNIIYHKDELMLEESAPDIFKFLDKMVERVPAGPTA